MFGIISDDVKLLVDVVARVGMDRGDGLVLGVHFKQDNIVSQFEFLKSKEILDLICLFYFKSTHNGAWVGPVLMVHKRFDLLGVCGV